MPTPGLENLHEDPHAYTVSSGQDFESRGTYIVMEIFGRRALLWVPDQCCIPWTDPGLRLLLCGPPHAYIYVQFRLLAGARLTSAVQSCLKLLMCAQIHLRLVLGFQTRWDCDYPLLKRSVQTQPPPLHYPGRHGWQCCSLMAVSEAEHQLRQVA